MKDRTWRILVLLAFHFIADQPYAQPSNGAASKYIRAVLEAKTDSLRLEAITQWFWEINISQPERADSLTEVEMAMARKMKSRYWISMAWNDKAILAIRHSDFPTALDYLNKSLEIRKQIGNPELLASTYNKLGTVYAQTNQHQKALPYLFQSLKYFQKIGRKNESGIVLSAIGVAFINQKDPPKCHPVSDPGGGLAKRNRRYLFLPCGASQCGQCLVGIEATQACHSAFRGLCKGI